MTIQKASSYILIIRKFKFTHNIYFHQVSKKLRIGFKNVNNSKYKYPFLQKTSNFKKLSVSGKKVLTLLNNAIVDVPSCIKYFLRGHLETSSIKVKKPTIFSKFDHVPTISFNYLKVIGKLLIIIF